MHHAHPERPHRSTALSAGLMLRLPDEPAGNDPEYESLWMLSGRRSRTGLLASLDVPAPERLVHVADQIQDFVHEELGRLELPATWPECPEHPASHPLTPELTSSGPSWVCPKSTHTIAPIGELSTPDASNEPPTAN
ncbi:MAG: hypothetical protein QOH84_4714 [Kribbellaceae bacterium]|jgi:hypothetical protein|nr:hypothetical protein [Kribbellaceae bacterium]